MNDADPTKEPRPRDKKDRLTAMKQWQHDQAQAYRTYIKTSAVGLEFGLSIAIGCLLGYFFDRYFGTSPYGLVVGLIIGSIAAAKRLIMFVKSYLNKHDTHDE